MFSFIYIENARQFYLELTSDEFQMSNIFNDLDEQF